MFFKWEKDVDASIRRLLTNNILPKTKELLLHQIRSGGKRLRPTLAILSCLALGGTLEDVLHAASGLEILHTYTLILDDIIDNSPKRRNKPTTWKKFGKSLTECIEADYGATLLDAVSQTKNPGSVAKIFAKTLKDVMQGEMEDVLLEQGTKTEPYIVRHRVRSINRKKYFHMIGKKTAALLQSSCEIGGLAANASSHALNALRNYGWHLGIAFQITDDILDLYGTKTGKPSGQDIRERKLGSILILFALKELPPKEKGMLLKSLAAGNIPRTAALIRKTKAMEEATKLAGTEIAKAKAYLSSIPPSPFRDSLTNVADYILQRKK